MEPGRCQLGKILDHQLTLECDQYLPVDEAAIPTGELSPVAETPMDFTTAHTIGERIDQVEGGYDHCWVVNGEQGTLRPAATVVDPETGRVMTVSTDQPGIQFYTGNFLNGEESNGGFNKNEGFCLETQLFPDSPNQPDFPVRFSNRVKSIATRPSISFQWCSESRGCDFRGNISRPLLLAHAGY